MPRYLLTVSQESAAALEYWLGGQLRIGPAAGTIGVPVAGLDAVTEEEIEPISARLRTGGPLYHTAARRAQHPLDADPPRPLTGPEAHRWKEARRGG